MALLIARALQSLNSPPQSALANGGVSSERSGPATIAAPNASANARRRESTWSEMSAGGPAEGSAVSDILAR
jgi:hypothetical protein